MPLNAAMSQFEAARPMLMGLAYRMLGSYSDAEDVVQDVAMQWMKADHTAIDVPSAWLTTVCTRKALDVLKSAQRTREHYVGDWLPEPVHTNPASGNLQTPENDILLAESLTTAFLLVLERLAPKERAAFLLHDVFGMSYKDIALSLDSNEAGCRKLTSRARANLSKADANHSTSASRQNELVSIFRTALETGSVDQLADQLAADVSLCSDGGGKAISILRTLQGPEVLTFIRKVIVPKWEKSEFSVENINASPTLIARQHGVAFASISFVCDDAGKVSHMFIMRNPEKMSGLHQNAAPKPIE